MRARLTLLAAALASGMAQAELRGSGDLGLVIERASGSVQIVETTTPRSLGRIEGLGDLSHATAVFSRDARHAFVFGRDGGLTKLDLLAGRIERRIVQAGNAIGGAISQDGRLVAVANYEPGGVKLFDARSLELVQDIPTGSKVVGIADVPGQGFIFSLFDGDAIWLADTGKGESGPRLTKFADIGRQPYDGLITPDGRHYIAGLFGEDGLALIDLWRPEAGARRILAGYGRGQEPLPVYKMPHLRGWAVAGGLAFLPAIGRHEVLVADTRDWKQVTAIAVHGQPVFAVARPDGRHVWVNFAHPRNDTVQVIDAAKLEVAHTLKPGRGVMHLEFTPRGDQLWLSVRDADRVEIYDTRGPSLIASLPAKAPSGILMAARAHRIGF
ncbi:MAG: protein nirF [Alphaproteobacteria bacterium]|nr:protein nirF [Alphaproteobacteria bacterium]